jgi:hypothetical protein
MDRLYIEALTGAMTSTTDPITTTPGSIGSLAAAPGGAPAPIPIDPGFARRAIERRAFATLATASPAGAPHVAGVLYEAVAARPGDAGAGVVLYVSTPIGSRKARNVAADPRVAVCIPVRRLPVGPPSSIQFQGRAEVLALDDPDVTRLAAAGELKAITSHGELELDGGCFLRITPSRRVHTYGLGLSLRALLRDPLAAGGLVDPAAS